MAKKFYAVLYQNGQGKIYRKLIEFKYASKRKGVVLTKGFQSYTEAEMWLEDPEAFPKEKTYYAVKKGKQPGIYRNLDDYQAQLQGYRNSEGKVFYTEEGAREWLQSGGDQEADGTIIEPLRDRLKGWISQYIPTIFLIIYRKWQLRNMLQQVAQEANPWVFCRINTNHRLVIYTAASCHKGERAGYAAVIIDGVTGAEFYVGGIAKEIGDSNRAELYAIISALRLIDVRCKATVEIRTDANSLVQVAKPKKLRKIKALDWDSRFIPNADLWKEYYKVTQQRSVTITWVRGHSGDKYNVLCDKIAGNCSL